MAFALLLDVCCSHFEQFQSQICNKKVQKAPGQSFESRIPLDIDQQQ